MIYPVLHDNGSLGEVELPEKASGTFYMTGDSTLYRRETYVFYARIDDVVRQAFVDVFVHKDLNRETALTQFEHHKLWLATYAVRRPKERLR